jgi:hypothetical protein
MRRSRKFNFPKESNGLGKLKEGIIAIWKESLRDPDDEVVLRIRSTAMDGSLEVFVESTDKPEVIALLSKFGDFEYASATGIQTTSWECTLEADLAGRIG